jgi:hypothetical protein
MGVMVDNVSPELASSLHLKDGNGAVITGVDQDGPACRGIEEGRRRNYFKGKWWKGQTAGGPHPFQYAGATVSMTIVREAEQGRVRHWATGSTWRIRLPPVAGTGMAFVPPTPPMPPRVSRYRHPDVHFAFGAARNLVEPLSPVADFFGVPSTAACWCARWRRVVRGWRDEGGDGSCV